MDEKLRTKTIVKTSIIGILVNIALATTKAIVGFFASSIAVILDAVNNLSDALSSVITIVGAKLASKKPTKKHPLGFGRIEYISAMIVSAIILYAGITALVESIKKIIEPEAADYSYVSLILIGVAVITKVILGIYVIKKGEKVKSSSLVASGKDALFDAILSFSVLVCAIISLTANVSIEAYVGVLISLFIVKAGIEMMLETLNDILGHRIEPELSIEIKEIIKEEQNVLGAYDLLVNNYGPNKNYASVHIEIPENLQASEIDSMTRRIQQNVFNKTGIILSGVSVYSYNTSDLIAVEARDKIKEIVFKYYGVLGFHGFYMNRDNKDIRFDVVFKFGVDVEDTISKIKEDILKIYECYTLTISPDIDLSD